MAVVGSLGMSAKDQEVAAHLSPGVMLAPGGVLHMGVYGLGFRV